MKPTIIIKIMSPTTVRTLLTGSLAGGNPRSGIDNDGFGILDNIPLPRPDTFLNNESAAVKSRLIFCMSPYFMPFS